MRIDTLNRTAQLEEDVKESPAHVLKSEILMYFKTETSSGWLADAKALQCNYCGF